MKKFILIALIMIVGIALILNAAQSSKVLIDTMEISDGYHDVYLAAGTYHFEITANISTHIPYNPDNWWYWKGEIVGKHDHNPMDSIGFAVTTYDVYSNSANIYIGSSGTYSIKGGAYPIDGITMHSNEAKLYRTRLNDTE